MSRGDTDRFISTMAAVHSRTVSSPVLKNPEPKLEPYPLSSSALLSLVRRLREPELLSPGPGTSMLLLAACCCRSAPTPACRSERCLRLASRRAASRFFWRLRSWKSLMLCSRRRE